MLRDSASPVDRRWLLHGLATAALLLWIGFCYRDTAASMVAIWSRSDTFAHGFFIAPISLWLIWRQREGLAAATPAVSPIWALPMLLLGVCWWVGHVIAANVVVQFSFVGMLIAAVFFTLGWPVARLILFPLGFLLFAVPFGEFLLPVLIERTADFTIFALRLTGVPVYREGNNFLIPSGAWSVVEACSGVRYLIASVTVGTLFAYLNYTSWRRRAVFVAVSIVVPVVANWVRAYIVVMLGHLSNNQIATGVDHLVYGWLFFGIVISIMFAIGARWTEPQQPASSVGAASAARGEPQRATLPALRWAGLALVAGWLALPPMVGRLAVEGRAAGVAAMSLPAFAAPAMGPWQAQSTPPPQFGAVAKAGDAGPNVVVYQKELWQIGLSLTDEPLAHPSLQSLEVQPSIDAEPLSQQAQAAVLELHCGSRPVPAVAGQTAGGAADASGDRGGLLTVWRVQWDDGYVAGSDRWLRLHRALARLRGKVNDTAALSLIAPQSQPAAALKMFFEENCVAIDTYLRHRRDARRSDVTAWRQAGQ